MSSADTDHLAWTEYEMANPIIVPDTLSDPLPMTIDAAVQFERAHESRRGESDVIRCWGPTSFTARVHPASIERTLCILDTLAKSCLARGFLLRCERPMDPDCGISVVVAGVPIELYLSERMLRSRYQPTEKERRQQQRGALVSIPAYSYRPSGELSLIIGYRAGTWKDRRGHPLEMQLNEVMLGLRRCAASQIAKQHAYITEQKHMEELQHQRDTLHSRIAAEQKAIDHLHRDAAAWQKARILRSYIEAVEAQRASGDDKGATVAWARWAREQADRLDPLCSSPSSILDTPRRQYRELDQYEILNEDGSIERIWG